MQITAFEQERTKITYSFKKLQYVNDAIKLIN